MTEEIETLRGDIERLIQSHKQVEGCSRPPELRKKFEALRKLLLEKLKRLVEIDPEAVEFLQPYAKFLMSRFPHRCSMCGRILIVRG
jgi:hypothetical protein